MRKRRTFHVQQALVFATLCGVLVACSAGGGAFAPQDVFSTIIPKRLRASEERIAMAEFEPPSAAGTLVAADAARSAALEPDPDGYDKSGMASWYGLRFHGRQTANGETFNRAELTAAHLSLPLPSYVRVTNLSNDRSIVLRVNDRGPYSGHRLIDVSEQAAELLAFQRKGLTKVRVQYIGPAPEGVDDAAMLLASYRGPTLPVTDEVAFAETEAPQALGSGAVRALKSLVRGQPAHDRIFVAFQVADQAE